MAIAMFSFFSMAVAKPYHPDHHVNISICLKTIWSEAERSSALEFSGFG
jgi:hypothetical protein